MKKRITSLLLCLVMALSLLPATTVTAFAEGEKEITSVTISTDITPAAGAKLKWPAAPSGANYTVAAMWMSYSKMYYATNDAQLKRDMQENFGSSVPSVDPGSATYTNGDTYGLMLVLTPRSGYTFADKDTLKVKVGGYQMMAGDAEDFTSDENAALAMCYFNLETSGKLHVWEGGYAADAKAHWGVCRDGDGHVFELTRDEHYYQFKDEYKCDGICTVCGRKSTAAKPAVPAGGRPVSRSTVCGQSTTFSVSAAGDDLHYRWYRFDPDDVSAVKQVGYDAALQIRTPRKAQDDGAQYYCVVYNESGWVQTDAVTLTVDHKSAAKCVWYDQRNVDGETVYGVEYHFPVCASCGSICGAKEAHKMTGGTCTSCGFQYGQAKAPLQTVPLNALTKAGKALQMDLAHDAAAYVSDITVENWYRRSKASGYEAATPISAGSLIEEGSRYEAVLTVTPTISYRISTIGTTVTLNSKPLDRDYYWWDANGKLHVLLEDPGVMRNVAYSANNSSYPTVCGSQQVVEGSLFTLADTGILSGTGFTADIWGWCAGDKLCAPGDKITVNGDTLVMAVYDDAIADTYVSIDTLCGKRTPADITFETGLGTEVDAVVWQSSARTLGKNDSFDPSVNYTGTVTLKAVTAADKWGISRRYVFAGLSGDELIYPTQVYLQNGGEVDVTAATASSLTFRVVMVNDLRVAIPTPEAGKPLPTRRDCTVGTYNGQEVAYLSSLQWFSAPTDGPEDTDGLLSAGTLAESGRVYYARLKLEGVNGGMLATNAVTVNGVTNYGINDDRQVIVDNAALSVSGPAAAPVLKVEAHGDMPVLSWNEVPGAAGYWVSRSGSEGEEQRYYTYLTSYTDRAAVPGESYTYVVYALGNASHTSVSSNAVVFTLPVTKRSVTVTGGTGSGDYRPGSTVRITASAGSYRVFDRWVVLSGDVELEDARSETTSFVMPDGPVKIRAAYRDAVPANVTIGTAQVLGTGFGIRITWQKAANAENYSIYRKAAGDADWRCIANAISDSDTAYIDPTAQMGVTYTYAVKGRTGVNESPAFSGSVTARMTPAEVTLTDVQSGADGVTVTWKATHSNDTYNVYRKASGSIAWTTLHTGIKTTKWVDTTARQGTVYAYTVRAVNGGVTSASADAGRLGWLTSLTAPVATGGNSASSGKPTLTWKAVSGAASYEIYRAESADGSYALLGTTKNLTYTNTGAKDGVTYYYRVVAVNGSSRSGYSGAVKGQNIPVPPAPVIKIGNSATSGKPMLTWNAVSGATSYKVYRATSQNGTYSLLGTVTTTSYTNTGAQPGVTYYYKIKALRGTVESAYSNIVSGQVKTAAPKPSAPVVKIGNSASSGKPMLTWNAVSGATSYKVYRATSQSGTYSLLGTVTATSYTNTGAMAGTAYYYKVKAVNAAGESAYSNIVSGQATVTTLTLGHSAASGKPQLKWKAVSGAASYKVYRATAKNGAYTVINTTSALTYTNTGAALGTTYYYKVEALNSAGKSMGFSTIVEGKVAPVLAVGYSSVSGKPQLTWKAVPGATEYQVYRAAAKDGAYTKINTTTATSYVNTGAKAGTMYYYKIVAVKGTAASDFSNIVSAIPKK